MSDAQTAIRGKPGKSHGRSVVLAQVARDARLDRKFLLLITLSSAVATLGLLQNSAAVVIGAMLISPLMGPIMGLGFGLATIDSQLIRRALYTLGAGMGAAIVIAMALIWLSPIRDVTSELQARTQPTLLDLGVAVVGGIAGVYAILKKLSGTMVGVAIATALVPPLSTIGFGLVTARADFALGGALLFLTNTLAIAFSATVVARLNHFGPSLTPQHTAMQALGIVVVLGLLSIPLALSLQRLVREAGARGAVQGALTAQLHKGDRIDRLDVTMDGESLTVEGVLLVAAFDPTLSSRVEQGIKTQLGRPATVNLVQLRQERASTVDAQRALGERISALESRDSESAAVLASLATGTLIPRERITLDPQARRAVVLRNRAGEGQELAAAIDRTIEAARLANPLWLIDSAEASEGTGPMPAATAP